MKKLLSILLTLAMLLPTAAFAENDEIKVYLGGEQIQFDAFGVGDIKEFNANSKQLIANLNEEGTREVNIANSIWFNKDVGG